MIQFLISVSGHFDTVSILNVYEAALTYMISVNTNDFQQSKITCDHICVASRQYYSYMKLAF